MELKIPENGILPVWQPIGVSTNHLTRQIADKLGVKTSHTGTLDPMAEGVVIVLCGERRLQKIELASWKKTYEFEIAYGIETDSYDGLGLVKKVDFAKVDLTQLSNTLKDLEGPYTQEVPIYSAIKHKGKKLFVHANSGTEIEKLPEKSGTIYKLELLETRILNLHELIDEIIGKIEKVEGPLRQQEITENWKKLKISTSKDQNITIARILVENSRGLYVRSLSQDICKALGTIGFISNLVRTANGAYTKESCYNALNP